MTARGARRGSWELGGRLPGAEWEGCLSCAEVRPFLVTQCVSDEGLSVLPSCPGQELGSVLSPVPPPVVPRGAWFVPVLTRWPQARPLLIHLGALMRSAPAGRREEPSHLDGSVIQTYTQSPEVDLGSRRNPDFISLNK